jgi:hypothetical protein
MTRTLFLSLTAVLALTACAKKEIAVAEPAPVAAPLPPPAPPGAVLGSTAADRDGDGQVDGYYTSDGIYHQAVTPAPAYPPPRMAMRNGERG